MPDIGAYQMLKVSLLTNMVAPYRMPLFGELSKLVGTLRVLTCVDREIDRQWGVFETHEFSVIQLKGLTLNLKNKNGGWRIIHLKFGLLSELILHRPNVLVIGDASWTSFMGAFFCTVLGIRYVVWNEITPSSKVSVGVVGMIRRWMYRRASSFVASGAHAKDFLLKQGCESSLIHIARNTVDNDYYIAQRTLLEPHRPDIRARLGVGDQDFALAYVGQLITRKRVMEIIEAIATLPHDLSVKFLIAGDGPLQDSLRLRAEQLGIGSKVVFLGYTVPNDLCRTYVACDGLILISDDEPWGMVINEALLFGKRFLCSSSVGAGAEFSPQGGEVISDLAGLSSALEKFVRSRAMPPVDRNDVPSPAVMAQQFMRAIE